MTTYRMNEVIESVKISDFPYICDSSFVRIGTSKNKVLLNKHNIQPEELYIWNNFLALLEISDEDVNFGEVTYKNNGDISLYSVSIGLFKFDENSEELSLALRIGQSTTEYSTDNYIDATYIPIDCEKISKKVGKSTTYEFVYSVNGVQLELISFFQKKDNETFEYFYCAISSEDRTDKFVIPFILKKELKNDPSLSEIINRNWYEGKFNEVTREFGDGGSKLWLKVNKAFTKNFINKTFPQGGVFFLCNKGKYKFTSKDSHEKITSDIHSVDWEVIECSHPELIVENYVNAENSSLISLGEASTLTFSDAKINNEAYKWLVGVGNDYEKCVLIHIIDKNAKDVKHMPRNSLTQLKTRSLASIRKFPNMLKAYEKYSDDFISTNFAVEPITPPIKTVEMGKIPAMPNMEEMTTEDLYADYPATGGGMKRQNNTQVETPVF